MATTYDDIREVLEHLLAAGGGQVVCSDYGNAVRWRQRAYAFRASMQNKANAEYKLTPALAKTPYDKMVLRLDKGDKTVYVVFEQPTVTVIPNNPTPLGI